MSVMQSLENYETVQTWSQALKMQWEGDPLAEDPGKMLALSRFCEYAEKNPDELYAFCYLKKRDTGVRFASKKRREELTQQIYRFVDESGLLGVEKRRLRSNIYSFFTHNGVLI